MLVQSGKTTVLSTERKTTCFSVKKVSFSRMKLGTNQKHAPTSWHESKYANNDILHGHMRKSDQGDENRDER